MRDILGRLARLIGFTRRTVFISAAITSIVSAVAVVGWGGGFSTDVTSKPRPRPHRIMVVGDSISQGSSGDFTWRMRLYRHLVDAGVAVDMVGPRDTLYDNVTDQQGSQDYADPSFDADHDAMWGRMLDEAATNIGAEVTTARPDVILVLLGINDLTYGGEIADAEASARALVANAHAASPTTSIVFGTVLPTEFTRINPSFAAKIAGFNRQLAALAAASEKRTGAAGAPVLVADTAREIDVVDDLYDGTHPNARGEVKIAAGFADLLARRFGWGAPYPRPLPVVPIGPSVPPTVSITAGIGAASLRFTGSPGATFYWIWIRPAGHGEFVQLIRPFGVRDSPCLIAPLAIGVTYEVRLQAAKGSAGGAFSATVRVTPTSGTPDARTSPDGRGAN